MLGQVHTLASGTVASLNAVEARLQDHDRRLDHLASSGALVYDETDPTWRLALRIEALHAVPARVAVLRCGRGDILARLTQRSIDCYGVEPNLERCLPCLIVERSLYSVTDKIDRGMLEVRGGM